MPAIDALAAGPQIFLALDGLDFPKTGEIHSGAISADARPRSRRLFLSRTTLLDEEGSIEGGRKTRAGRVQKTGENCVG